MPGVYAAGMAESYLNRRPLMAGEGQRKTFDQSPVGGFLRESANEFAPEFSIGVDYEEKRLKEKREKQKEEKEPVNTDSPFIVEDGLQAKYKNVYPQAIASLHKTMCEVQQFEGNGAQQMGGLHDALNKTQWLMKACLSNFNGTSIPSDVARYMGDLSKVQSLLSRSLGGMTAMETQQDKTVKS